MKAFLYIYKFILHFILQKINTLSIYYFHCDS